MKTRHLFSALTLVLWVGSSIAQSHNHQVIYESEATKAYEEAVGWAARAAGVHEPCDGGVRLDIMLWMPDRRRRDLDNCAKSICDALNGIAYEDDSQIVELIIRRHVDRDRPRAEIRVETTE